jgi:hypothetical protein
MMAGNRGNNEAGPLGRERSSSRRNISPRRRKVAKWLGLLLFLSGVSLLIAGGVVYHRARQEAQEEVRKIRGAGHPVTFAELSRVWPEVPEADDAATWYRAALALRRQSTAEEVRGLLADLDALSERDEPDLSPDQAARIEGVLAANREALEMADRAAERPGCSYTFDLQRMAGRSDGQTGDRRLGDARGLSKLLCLRTKWLARQGLSSQAAGSLRSALRMLRIFDRQPTMVIHMVKLGGADGCVDSLPAILEGPALTPEELVRLEACLQDVSESIDLENVFIAERVHTLETVLNSIEPEPLLEPRRARSAFGAKREDTLGSRFSFRRWAIEECRMFARYIAAAGKGWPGCLHAFRTMESPEPDVFSFPAGFLLSSYKDTIGLSARALARLRSAQVAAMAVRYRLENGRLPATLDELREFTGQDLPVDPCTGEDFIYGVEDDGFEVRSAGTDLDERATQEDWGLAVRFGPRVREDN